MTLILGFAPFILFAMLSRLSADLALWAAFAAAFVVTIRDFVESPSLRLLDIGSLAVFGLLALGSPDALRFQSDMGTEFLEQIGDLASAALARLLAD